jgi:hypothetical protein
MAARDEVLMKKGLGRVEGGQGVGEGLKKEQQQGEQQLLGWHAGEDDESDDWYGSEAEEAVHEGRFLEGQVQQENAQGQQRPQQHVGWQSEEDDSFLLQQMAAVAGDGVQEQQQRTQQGHGSNEDGDDSVHTKDRDVTGHSRQQQQQPHPRKQKQQQRQRQGVLHGVQEVHRQKPPVPKHLRADNEEQQQPLEDRASQNQVLNLAEDEQQEQHDQQQQQQIRRFRGGRRGRGKVKGVHQPLQGNSRMSRNESMLGVAREQGRSSTQQGLSAGVRAGPRGVGAEGESTVGEREGVDDGGGGDSSSYQPQLYEGNRGRRKAAWKRSRQEVLQQRSEEQA